MGQHNNCQHLTMQNSPFKTAEWWQIGEKIYTILTTKNWKLTIHKSILKCDLSKVVHISRCPYPESSTVCVNTNTLKLGLSSVVHSLTLWPHTVICLRLYTVHDHLIIYLCTIPTLWFKRKKHLYDMTWLIKMYIYPLEICKSLNSYIKFISDTYTISKLIETKKF